MSFFRCRSFLYNQYSIVHLQGVERELVASGVIEVHDNIISLNPNVNG
jgi:hypothetical protein